MVLVVVVSAPSNRRENTCATRLRNISGWKTTNAVIRCFYVTQCERARERENCSHWERKCEALVIVQQQQKQQHHRPVRWRNLPGGKQDLTRSPQTAAANRWNMSQSRHPWVQMCGYSGRVTLTLAGSLEKRWDFFFLPPSWNYLRRSGRVRKLRLLSVRLKQRRQSHAHPRYIPVRVNIYYVYRRVIPLRGLWALWLRPYLACLAVCQRRSWCDRCCQPDLWFLYWIFSFRFLAEPNKLLRRKKKKKSIVTVQTVVCKIHLNLFFLQ